MRSLAVSLIGAHLLLGLVCSARVAAEELLPGDVTVELAIDTYVDRRLEQENVTAAPPGDDLAYLRRVVLDLAGRVPTSSEVLAYSESNDPRKRELLVDRLLASPDFVFHQRNELDMLLLGTGGNDEWRDWLRRSIEEGRNWPTLFSHLIRARETDPAEKHGAAFLKSRAANLDDLTNDTSRIFFGVSINCAKCHDHPLVLDWTQDHYFGLASFFSRTYLTKKQFLAERDEGALKFRTTAGEEKQAGLMYLTGLVVTEPEVAPKTDEQKQLAEKKQQADNELETPPEPPAYSRREKLIEVALQPDPNGFFARAFVNRVWARLLGVGLVTPLDQMHSENKPSHPELLAWLARDAVAHDYDLRRLMRGIVLSRAYGRTSRWEGSGDRPAEHLFAVAHVRPLTPMQFSLSLSIATSNPLDVSGAVDNLPAWPAKREELEKQARDFSRQFEIPVENFQVGVGEALLFSNSERIERDYLRESPDRLPGVLLGISDRSAAIAAAFRAVLGRGAEPEEIDAMTAYLSAREDRRAGGVSQMIWSLVASGEFRFNH
jgi:Protein of unknown function (DUF1549)/Protein of unknown function (DUF1553)